MDWLIPGVITASVAVLVFSFWSNINIYGSSGLIARVLSFIQSLPGFYIAALAAIATFGRNDIDNIIPRPTPTITELRDGEENVIPLTRRRFLCMMFAFLTAESVLLILASITILSFAGDYKGGATLTLTFMSKLGFVIYLFFLFQMILATFWGLFYLGDRIHQTD